MITNFKKYNESNDHKDGILQYPISRSGKFGGEGTHVRILPDEKRLKKHWNKIGYVTINSNGQYALHDMSGLGNSETLRLAHPGQHYSIFYTPAYPGIDFNWINNSLIYDNNSNIVGNFNIKDFEFFSSIKKYNL